MLYVLIGLGLLFVVCLVACVYAYLIMLDGEFK